MGSVKVLVVTGYGINCEKELALAFSLSGAESTIVHTGALLSGAVSLDPFHILAFPGGFSFGDELGAGKAFANRLSYAQNLYEKLTHFVEQGKCILGICNGFQLLVKLGLLSGSKDGQTLSLAHNNSAAFESRWTCHKVLSSPCVFTKGLESLYLPVRHAEGKLVAKDTHALQTLFDSHQVVLQYMDDRGEQTMKYPFNPNGSFSSIAGVCDPTGRIFGLMPHPEAALFFTNHPQWQRIKDQCVREGIEVPKMGPGLALFQNGVEYIRSSYEW